MDRRFKVSSDDNKYLRMKLSRNNEEYFRWIFSENSFVIIGMEKKNDWIKTNTSCRIVLNDSEVSHMRGVLKSYISIDLMLSLINNKNLKSDFFIREEKKNLIHKIFITSIIKKKNCYNSIFFYPTISSHPFTIFISFLILASTQVFRIKNFVHESFSSRLFVHVK